ncbi:L-lactate dehydrogenase [bacterium]|jgi:L-lactate dehydrogenase|nr:L-lactate dehydrogenase [bacterium]MBT6832211.1 L-lactate dehydrogenase [bacterium]MBT7772236.1 L-lactate dehydrogenase [bacterium]
MKKVAIIGVGNVGAHVASAAVLRNLPIELLLIDQSQEFETGQVLDLRDSLQFSPHARVRGADLGDAEVANADIFVITAGAAQKPGDTRLDLLDKNVKILKSILTKIGKIKKTAIVILVANPVDILTQIAHEILELPRGHVFGTGTLLDSSRLRWRLAEIFKKNIEDVDGFVLGEHGDSEFVAWSTVENSDEFSDEKKNELEHTVRRAAYEIIDGKGATFFGIGAATAEILEHILLDSKKILPVSVPLFGEFGIHGIAVGVPARIGAHGVSKIEEIELVESEYEKLLTSATGLRNLLDRADY